MSSVLITCLFVGMLIGGTYAWISHSIRSKLTHNRNLKHIFAHVDDLGEGYSSIEYTSTESSVYTTLEVVMLNETGEEPITYVQTLYVNKKSYNTDLAKLLANT